MEHLKLAPHAASLRLFRQRRIQPAEAAAALPCALELQGNVRPEEARHEADNAPRAPRRRRRGAADELTVVLREPPPRRGARGEAEVGALLV